MGLAHVHAPLLELMPDGAVINSDVVTDSHQRLAFAVELFGRVDLLI